MFQSLPESTGPVSPVSNSSRKAIVIAWLAFVIGPFAVTILISHPVLVAGIAIGVGLSILVRRIADGIHTSDSPGELTSANRVAADGGVLRDAGTSNSD